MAGIKTLSSLHKMKRSVKMRDGSLSDDEMVTIMEEMINQAIVAQATGNERMMKRSLNELRQVRKDTRTGNIGMNSSGTQGKMIGRFSHLIDQLEGEGESVKKESTGGGAGLMSSMPSAETFISAIMTANPMLGYSAKILKDIGGGVKNKKQVDKETAQRQAKILEEQRDYILGKKDELEIESDINEEQKTQITKYDQILERIEMELVRLRKLWEGDDTTLVQEPQQGATADTDTVLVQESQDTNNKLGKLVEAEERLIEEQKLQREQDRFDSIEKGRQQDGNGISLPTGKGKGGKKGGGILSRLLSGLGGGIMAGVSGLFSIISTLGTVGLKLLKLGVKGSVIGLVIMSVYNFLDGFFNAGDILDMDDADLNIGDRIIAGYANLWGQIIKLFDWVLELFGLDLFDSEDIEKKIAKTAKAMVDKVVDWVFGLFDNIHKFITEFDIGEILNSIKEKSIEFMKNLVKIIPEMVTDAFESVSNMFGNAKDWLFGGDEDKTEEQKKEEKRQGSNTIMGQYELSNVEYNGVNTSDQLADRMGKMEDVSYNSDNQHSSAVVSGNNNTSNVYNNTEVHTTSNVTNPDETFRSNNLKSLDRLRFS